MSYRSQKLAAPTAPLLKRETLPRRLVDIGESDSSHRPGCYPGLGSSVEELVDVSAARFVERAAMRFNCPGFESKWLRRFHAKVNGPGKQQGGEWELEVMGVARK